MDIRENADLASHSTMRLGGQARYLANAKTEAKVKKLTEWAKHKNLPMIVIGEGSNIVWRDEGFSGLVIVNEIPDIKILHEDDNNLTVRAGAGEIWDKLVAWSVKKNLSGIEFLSRIPGTVGAAPVQNIGAYGAELADTFIELAALDTLENKFVTLTKKQCRFAYRTSRFKTSDKGRFIITFITLKLNKTNPSPPFYESLENYFKEHKVDKFTPQSIREAVTAIRKIKLPDPSVVNNNGSFFVNPIIGSAEFEKLKQKYPDVKAWFRSDGKMKISAGWLLETAGFKDIHDQETGMATWHGSALVMVNEHAKKTEDLLKFKNKILSKVHEMFGLVLEQEPELLP